MGAGKFTVINSLELDNDGVVLEIGSERGEGSTQYIYDFCKQNDLVFFTIDFEDDAFSRAKNICGECAYQKKGEDFLNSFEWKQMDKNITFAYLDNFDWMWNPNITDDSYTRQISLYSSYDLEMNNGNSQLAHLDQAKLVDTFSSETCYILFDDTFVNSNGDFDGKGGLAISYLLENNWEIVQRQDDGLSPEFGWFLLKKKIC